MCVGVLNFFKKIENMVSQPGVHVAARFYDQSERNSYTQADFQNSDFGPQGGLFYKKIENMVL